MSKRLRREWGAFIVIIEQNITLKVSVDLGDMGSRTEECVNREVYDYLRAVETDASNFEVVIPIESVASLIRKHAKKIVIKAEDYKH